jgi:CRISPR/Cas system type I-B associated protein Csh2 (Cas7 group RAMP superfamily)
VAEGWPTDAVEKGILRSVEDRLVELLALLRARSERVPDDVRTLSERLSRLLEERDTHYDLTEGRAHDCAACLGRPRRLSE